MLKALGISGNKPGANNAYQNVEGADFEQLKKALNQQGRSPEAVEDAERELKRKQRADAKAAKEEHERLAKFLKMPAMLGQDNVERMKNQKAELDALRIEIDN